MKSIEKRQKFVIIYHFFHDHNNYQPQWIASTVRKVEIVLFFIITWQYFIYRSNLNYDQYYKLMKQLIIFAVLTLCALTLHLHHEESPTPDNTQPRIRRSILALNATERKAFFWSLKALDVLPPPKTYDYWTYASILAGADNATIKRNYIPKP
jgi:hypothetical protein